MINLGDKDEIHPFVPTDVVPVVVLVRASEDTSAGATGS